MAYILNENFTGAVNTLPSSATWNVINSPGAPNYGSQDSEYYVNNTNIVYQDGSTQGNLVMVLGTKGTDGATAGTWPSARCDTQGKYAVQPGNSCEIRAKLFPLTGAWPACWFAGVNSSYPGSWTEVDMQESGDPNADQSYVTIWGPGSGNPVDLGSSGAFNVNDGNFHIWRFDYYTNQIQIFIDNVLNFTLTEASVTASYGSSEWLFNNNGGMYVILNVAVSVAQYGTPNAGSLPKTIMEVDYVRIWAPTGPDPNGGGGGGGGTGAGSLVQYSGPVSAHSNTNSVTTASYTPIAGTLQVAMASVGNGDGENITAATLTDTSGSGAWTLLSGPTIPEATGYGAVWVKNAWSGAATVTFSTTASVGTATGVLLTVIQFGGAAAAASQTGATASTQAATVNTQAITPTQTGSQVVGSFGTGGGSYTFTENGATTIYSQYDGDPNGDTAVTFQATAQSTAGTPVTLGFTTAAVGSSTFALAEILTAPAAGVSLPIAQVTATAYPPGIPIKLTTAQVRVNAPPVHLPGPQVVALAVAQVTVRANAPGITQARSLLATIASQGGTDDYGNAYQAGIEVFNGAANALLHVNAAVGAPALELPTGVASEEAHAAIYAIAGNTGTATELIATWLLGAGSSFDKKQAAISLVSATANGSTEAAGELIMVTGDPPVLVGYWDSTGIHMASGYYVTADTWHAMPAFATHYSHGTPVPAYKINADQTVSFAGEVNVTSGAAGATFVTLPTSSYFPVSTKKFPVTISAGTPATTANAQVTIDTSGGLTLSGVPTGAAYSFSLDVVRYPLDY